MKEINMKLNEDEEIKLMDELYKDYRDITLHHVNQHQFRGIDEGTSQSIVISVATRNLGTLMAKLKLITDEENFQNIKKEAYQKLDEGIDRAYQKMKENIDQVAKGIKESFENGKFGDVIQLLKDLKELSKNDR
jgi:predicted hydrocarbon binding protein